MSFVHLHLHTEYSILDGLTKIPALFERAAQLGMPAVAITDHGNMYGVPEFLKAANSKSNKNPDGTYKVKPIVGCEVYVTKHFPHTVKNKGYYHLILLAKNYNGYKNLMKLVSLSHIEGMYYKPRISHELLQQYHEDLICCAACLAGEIAQDIRQDNIDAAREAIKWHKDLFGEDYYLEVMLHKTQVPGMSLELYEEQKKVYQTVMMLSSEMGVKVVASNDVHFLNKDDGPTHDRLICLTTNSLINDSKRLRYTQQEYLKSREEMEELFWDHPEILDNTLQVASKVQAYSIERPPVLPKFNIDKDFLSNIDHYLELYKDVIDEGRVEGRGQEFFNSVAYLCHLTYQGAHKRYGQELSEEQKTRIDFELKTISKMGFPDYFLIVQDYIAASRKMGYLVGPGRGSAAGSVVAYCLWITNLDPIHYHLLFERFLNPDRINMPDIDVDFENLAVAHDYVEKTYGANHVSRVITYGTMAAKSSIKDVARISELSIDESNRLTKMVPDRLSEKKEKEYVFDPQFDEVKPGFKVVERQEDGKTKHYQVGLEDTDVKINLKSCYRLVPEFIKELAEGTDINKEVLHFAGKLEGTVRQVGQHACATIIGPSDLTEHMPITLSKDKETGLDVWTSQYDGHFIESVGMLKMDFLGLNTLSIIHECLNNIKDRYGIEIDIEDIDKGDKATYELYGRGDTTAVFQFESEGMKNYLRQLHPERFEDLIAMNALYRPGPMDYIPDFIDRKMGVKPIEYDLDDMAEYLEDTYGICVYQEQVMLLSQKLANFTKGEADTLRKAMGKKLIAVLNSLKEKFMSGGVANGHPAKVLDKIWKDWEKFASYAFNKSHATCYAWVSYQTGWLKCHYMPEFLAANLSCNLSNMEEIKKLMADCKAHKIPVLNPDINESSRTFKVNSKGEIRFGLGGIKGLGENIVNFIIDERKQNGVFRDIWDFIERTCSIVNRKAMECLCYSGAFDSFGKDRSLYICPNPSGVTFLEDLMLYSDRYKKDSLNSGISLFGDVDELKPVRPPYPSQVLANQEEEILKKEKEVVGMYLSSHPLDKYRYELTKLVTCELTSLNQFIESCANNNSQVTIVNVGGTITSIQNKVSKKGSPMITFVLEDFSGSYEFALFGKDVDAFKPMIQEKADVYIRGEVSKDNFRNAYKYKLVDMISLGNVTDSELTGIKIDLLAHNLDSERRISLLKLVQNNPGKIPLSFCIYDKKSGYRVDLNSKKYRVRISSEFMEELESLGFNATVSKRSIESPNRKSSYQK